jgi:hypothetical protein
LKEKDVESLECINFVRHKLKQLGVSATTLAALADVNTSDLSLYLRGLKPAPMMKALRLHHEMSRLVSLDDAMGPFHLDWNSAPYRIKRLLDLVDEGLITVRIEDHSKTEKHIEGLKALNNKFEGDAIALNSSTELKQ